MVTSSVYKKCFLMGYVGFLLSGIGHAQSVWKETPIPRNTDQKLADMSGYVHNFADAPRLDASAPRDVRFTDARGQNELLQGKPSSRYVPYEVLEKSAVFQVFVGGEEVFVAREKCFGDSTFHTSQFFVDGSTEITVTSASPITTYAIRPYHKKITGTVAGNQLIFRVSEPEMLMATINDYKPLCLFQTPLETDVPDRDDSNVVYFPAGTHKVGLISPKSGQTSTWSREPG